MTSAYVMYSGGLDSMLAAMLMRRQGIRTVCVTFSSAFFTAEKARESAEKLGFETLVRDITDIHLAMVKNPPHGYGKNMNPCIDCHAMMFRTARNLLDSEEGDFLVSGEVLNQRPMSQNERALKVVESTALADGLLLRPLSAKLLDPTPMELDGRVNRDYLMDFQGRNRKPQMDLAASFNITEYPSPAGGCKLTDPRFSARLRELLNTEPNCTARDALQLGLGRHFRFSGGSKLIIARDSEESEMALATHAWSDDILMEAADVSGPVAIIPAASFNENDMDAIFSLFSSYLKEECNEIRLFGINDREISRKPKPQPMTREKVKNFLI